MATAACPAPSRSCRSAGRMPGTWPDWCAGARTAPPFSPHAWAQAGGRTAGEQAEAADLRPLTTVSAHGGGSDGHDDTAGGPGRAGGPGTTGHRGRVHRNEGVRGTRPPDRRDRAGRSGGDGMGARRPA
ncbi:lasso peptide biosynthesis B2 protein [Streptomyces nitrosporeus]|uniref:lasso peptide biosynthesis B2 protein n=1 Tax=Streptomyces nitrosporeus TaxID=28894 RepID=UPI00399F0233